MLQMGCNLASTQLCCAHTQLPYTRGINLSLKTWPGVKSVTSGRNEAAGAAQKHGPSACLPATRHNFDRLFICRKETAFDFTDVPGNPRLSVKGVWMGVKVWSDMNPGLVKQKRKNLSLSYGYGAVPEGVRGGGQPKSPSSPPFGRFQGITGSSSSGRQARGWEGIIFLCSEVEIAGRKSSWRW